MLFKFIWMAVMTYSLASYASPMPALAPAPTSPRIQWWRDARFGMFIHWGPVSLTGREISWSRSHSGPFTASWGETPAAEYDQLYKRFDPVHFDAKAWVDIARRNGMKYIVLTAKHHDGFMLWDTKTSDYNIMHTPFGRDVVKELAQAAREAGIRFGVYFSPADMMDTDCRDPVNNPRFVERMHAQLTELLTNYGEMPIVWFDYEGMPCPSNPAETAALVRKLSPNAIINNRLDVIDPDESHGAILHTGDFLTPEQFVGSYCDQVPWETNMTVGDQWSYKPNDRVKSVRKCLEILLNSIGGDGNLLLNVGPTPLGDIEPAQVEVLDRLGAWVNAHGEAIYGTRGGPFTPWYDYVSTRTADAIYVHALKLKSGTVRLPAIKAKVISASTLQGTPVAVEQDDTKLNLIVPPAAQEPEVTVIKLKVEGVSPLAIGPIYPASRSGSFAYRRPVEATSSLGAGAMHDAAAVLDDDDRTFWTTGRAPGAFERAQKSYVHFRAREIESLWLHSGALTIDLQEPKQVARIVLKEKIPADRYAPVKKWSLTYLDGDVWREAVGGESIGATLDVVLPSRVTGQQFKLSIEADGRPAISEVQLYNDIPSKPQPQAIQRWRDMRFGMFIHWGPVSLKGTEIGWSRGSQVPIAEYDQLYQRFDAAKFNAEEWVRLVKASGMKYIVLTTKHHDGFCLWNTKETDYNVMHSPLGRDVVKELSDACKREGIAFGTYYSTCDWHHPAFPLGSPGGNTLKPTADLDAYNRYLDAQVNELITKYGPLLTMWFDVPQEFDRPRGQATIDKLRALQPDILVNNRVGAEGDFETPEQYIGAYRDDRPWETNMTLCQQWAWKPNDKMKSLEECLHTLVRTVGGDGNFLFNVGPQPDGQVEARQADRLREMGAWMVTHGKAIYETRGGPWMPSAQLASTRRGETVYVHVLKWPDDGVISLAKLPRAIRSAKTFHDSAALSVTEKDGHWLITVPSQQRESIDTIIELTLDGSAMELKSIKP